MGTGPTGSVFGENSFYRETRGTRLGGRHVAKRSSDPRVAYPEVKIQVRDLVRVVGIVVPFTHGDQYSGKIRFIVPQCINRHRRAAARHGRARQNSGTGPCGDCRRVLCVPDPWGQYSGPVGSVFGENSFDRETRSTRL